MADACDITTVDEAAWTEAVARELVLRRLASRERLGRAEIVEACRELGVGRGAALSAFAGLQDPSGDEFPVYRTRTPCTKRCDGSAGKKASGRRAGMRFGRG